MTVLRIGPRSKQWLTAVGVHTLEDLEDLGAREACRRAKTAFPGEVSLNLLYGLQGLLMSCTWNKLPPAVKDDLKKWAEGL